MTEALELVAPPEAATEALVEPAAAAALGALAAEAGAVAVGALKDVEVYLHGARIAVEAPWGWPPRLR